MPYSVRYTGAAAAEVEIAISSYARPEVDQASAFVRNLERTEGEIRRAVLRRFPYSLFYVIEQDQVIVPAFMHPPRKAQTREELLKR